MFNVKVVRTATGPDLIDPRTSAEDVARARRRSLSVLLGAAGAVALGFVLPQIAQAGPITIPLWRRMLTGG